MTLFIVGWFRPRLPFGLRLFAGAVSSAILLTLTSQPAYSADDGVCGALRNGFGPFDYRTATPDQRSTVELPHFPPYVESLKKGATSERIGHDIDFVLRAFPNHHRALMAMAKLSRREKRSTPLGANYPIDCYFERAIRFQPDDPMPYGIAGAYFAQSGQRDTALTYLEKAGELSDGNANLHYNLGLAYLELGLTERAVEQAKRAYAAGFPLEGLKNRLRALGAWQE